MEDVQKKEHVPGIEGTALKNKNSQIEGKVFPRFPLTAMSHADIIFCWALTYSRFNPSNRVIAT
jgi:hypothetical protein